MKRFALLTILLTIILPIFSQIQHVDYGDSVVYLIDSTNRDNDSLYLDLNSDGKFDIVFASLPSDVDYNGSHFIFNNAGFYLPTYPDTNKVISYIHYEALIDSSMPATDTITADSEICFDTAFKRDTLIPLAIGIFNNGVQVARLGKVTLNKYIGIQFYDNQSNVYFGRINLSVSNECDSITIHSWEYESSSGNCINSTSNIQEYLTPFGVHVIFDSHSIRINESIDEIASLSIYNMNGEQVISKTNQFHYTSIEKLNKGIYILKISSKKGNTITSKFVN